MCYCSIFFSFRLEGRRFKDEGERNKEVFNLIVDGELPVVYRATSNKKRYVKVI
ncbi:hypothetical protein GCM10023331_20730 [Algivirga pacifica]|uniref:Uncharacterized protein n=1 Tax=Algivirga pacifica TaxID=1162670 RepID=A0ABP9DD29_9BACT